MGEKNRRMNSTGAWTGLGLAGVKPTGHCSRPTSMSNSWIRFARRPTATMRLATNAFRLRSRQHWEGARSAEKQVGRPNAGETDRLCQTDYGKTWSVPYSFIFDRSGAGLPTTRGFIFFNTAPSRDNKGSVMIGNNCLCPKPGPETGCGCD